MAPPKGVKSNGLISNFFKPFITQKAPNSLPQEIGDEIVVAARPPLSQQHQQQPTETCASQTKTTPTKRKPGRPRKSPASSVSKSSQSDGSHTPKRRGRPRKHPLPSSPSQSSHDGVKKSSRPVGRPRKTESQRQRDEQLGGSASSPIQLSETKSERFNINPLTDEADITPTEDSPFRPAGDSPKQRIAKGVAALSPSPPRKTTTEMPAPPLPQPQFGTPADKTPNASFSSISTLTTVPNSQASSFPVSSSTSSRRIVSDGLQGVTGSDSESEDLEDIQTVYANKRRKLSQDDGVKAAAPKQPPPQKNTRLSDQEKSKNFFKAFPRSPAKPVLKNSLASLLADHEKDQMADATIASLESAVEESKKQEEREQALEDAGYDGDAIVAAAGSDSEDREKVIMALARTEALHKKGDYHFFLDPEPLHTNSPFPTESLPDEPWARIYRNDVSRREACVSGFAAELAAKFPLPMTVTSWMACQLQYEQSEELCEAYVEILRASGHDDQSISDTWGSLNSIYKARSLFENNWREHVKTALPRGLSYMVRLISFRAPSIDNVVSEASPNSTCAAFLDLTLMNVDELVKADISLSLLIADCIEDMLDALSEHSFHKLIPLVVGTMFSPSDLPEFARCRAIAALPASTPRAHKIRRRLALEYFNTTEKKACDPPDWPKSIIHTLKSKLEFHISESTDYALLTALTTVLDIAIDAGWTDYSLLAPRESTGPWGERQPPSAAETKHNKDIDAITDVLKILASRIRDAGTSHLRRTETKSAIEQVMARLQFCVRSRARPTKDVFDEKVMKQARFDVSSFARKDKDEEKDEREFVEVVPVEDLSGREADEEEDATAGGSEGSGSECLEMV
ncbi:hypothetical protein M409DRAFT_60234 [Zasmidium cellare ATCC 36951]|uniref:Coiled-coil SMC6 And NSE5 INteracting (CANIN) domain-containing protein n=1 Tax=Zasmidium cellare ATCC 36951 TaxID=1080233 RepID=A0A6A6BZ95_ZASCE|nr:uncharacterized protein M409DRAFT_60234 [Zasmidium cellare ATCC 36951]KAF2160124.1 hypothetical protein M409DRAFT_60234 [Zasmidium cellare ATCC 36951]